MKSIFLTSLVLASLLSTSAFGMGRAKHPYLFQLTDRSAFCANDQGKEGLNPATVGQCGDFKGQELSQKKASRTVNRLQKKSIDLKGSVFSTARLSGIRFDSASLWYTNFDSAQMESVVFENPGLNGASFRGTDLTHVHFVNANLLGSVFDENTTLPFTEHDGFRAGMIRVNHSANRIEGVNLKGVSCNILSGKGELQVEYTDGILRQSGMSLVNGFLKSLPFTNPLLCALAIPLVDQPIRLDLEDVEVAPHQVETQVRDLGPL